MAGALVVGIVLSWQISLPFTITMAGVWIMGCVYNIPPARTKDVPYLDVVTESVNSPLRMLAGWYITRSDVTPTTSLLISYWMVGCYFMAIKRYAEYRQIANHARAAGAGNPSNTTRGNGSSFPSCFMRRRLCCSLVFSWRGPAELILLFPFIAVVMAVYFHISFENDSAAQAPEKLYKNKLLMAPCCLPWPLESCFFSLGYP